MEIRLTNEERVHLNGAPYCPLLIHGQELFRHPHHTHTIRENTQRHEYGIVIDTKAAISMRYVS